MADYKLTAAEAEALTGLTPFSKDAVSKFTPACYNKDGIAEHVRPIFHLKALTRKAKKDMVKKGMEVAKADSEVDLDEVKELIRPFIVNFEQYYDRGSLELIEYKTDADGFIAKEIFHDIPAVVINEITGELMTMSGLKEPEALGLK